MIDLIFFLIAGYGATNIIVDGSIFYKVREWVESKSQFFGDLLNCHMCAGFWVGFIFSFFFDYNFFLAGCAVSGFSWIIDRFIKE